MRLPKVLKKQIASITRRESVRTIVLAAVVTLGGIAGLGNSMEVSAAMGSTAEPPSIPQPIILHPSFVQESQNTIAYHYSHESHASHSSHYSHYSSRY